jgi:hypothetical protein
MLIGVNRKMDSTHNGAAEIRAATWSSRNTRGNMERQVYKQHHRAAEITEQQHEGAEITERHQGEAEREKA